MNYTTWPGPSKDRRILLPPCTGTSSVSGTCSCGQTKASCPNPAFAPLRKASRSKSPRFQNPEASFVAQYPCQGHQQRCSIAPPRAPVHAGKSLWLFLSQSLQKCSSIRRVRIVIHRCTECFAGSEDIGFHERLFPPHRRLGSNSFRVGWMQVSSTASF